jgi:hypothetical protein
MLTGFLDVLSYLSLCQRKGGRRSERVRLALERLEDRLAPAAPPPRVLWVTKTTDPDPAEVQANVEDPTKFTAVKNTLRWAIAKANHDRGADAIEFKLPQNARTINLMQILPTITDKVTIDTGDGWSRFEDDPDSMVTLSGTNLDADGIYGLCFEGAGASGSSVRGLRITRFSGDGVRIIDANSVTIGGTTQAGGNLIDENGNGISIVGPNNTTGSARGVRILGNNIKVNKGDGILIRGGGADVIGGRPSNLAKWDEVQWDQLQNELRFNGTNGLEILDSDNNAVYGNEVFFNKSDGILIHGNSPNNTIGGKGWLDGKGVLAGAANAIYQNDQNGIEINGAGTKNTRILGNYVGVQPNQRAFGNKKSGIYLLGTDRIYVGADFTPALTSSGNSDEVDLTVVPPPPWRS